MIPQLSPVEILITDDDLLLITSGFFAIVKRNPDSNKNEQYPYIRKNTFSKWRSIFWSKHENIDELIQVV